MMNDAVNKVCDIKTFNQGPVRWQEFSNMGVK
jgi:hypothetical protein